MTDKWKYTPACKTKEEGDEIFLRAARAVAFENCDDIWWREDDGIITTLVDCSDFFAWGTSDAEPITMENIELFEQIHRSYGFRADLEEIDLASLLWCARVRGMRPQGAYYKYFSKFETELFHECGPEREVGLFNPKTPEQAAPVEGWNG
jgi:hypothetical protein